MHEVTRATWVKVWLQEQVVRKSLPLCCCAAWPAGAMLVLDAWNTGKGLAQQLISCRRKSCCPARVADGQW